MIKKSCKNCEFAMSGNGQIICSGRSDDYGRNITELIKLFPDGCEEWEISFNEFQKLDIEDLNNLENM